jgi:hypothetical protein
MGTRSTFPGVKRGRNVMLTTDPHLLPISRISRSYTLLPFAHAWQIVGQLYFLLQFRLSTAWMSFLLTFLQWQGIPSEPRGDSFDSSPCRTIRIWPAHVAVSKYGAPLPLVGLYLCSYVCSSVLITLINDKQPHGYCLCSASDINFQLQLALAFFHGSSLTSSGLWNNVQAYANF